MTLQPGETRRRSVNSLHSASNVKIMSGSSSNEVDQGKTDKETSEQNNYLDLFFARIAPNAILNAGGRADEVRCHPGTRQELITTIEKWIDGDGDLSQRILWLSGPPGAGKSAIIQTVAERGRQRRTPMANYFFFRGDSSRNHAGPVVATLLHQLRAFYPPLRARIPALLKAKPLIFDQSIQDQFEYLIDNPMRAVFNNSAHTKRLVFLIDGLDECGPGPKHVQGDLLRALHHLSSQQGSPFFVLVASRAEPHLTMAFNEIGCSSDSIFLDDEYRPSNDIRLFVTAQFDNIKKNHSLGQTLGGDWPSKALIDEIVKKSRGQFIYAATVMRFILSSPASPPHSGERVCSIQIAKHSPFAELDAIYTHILSQAEEWDLVKDILASQFILPAVKKSNLLGRRRRSRTCYTLLAPLGLTQSAIESSLSDLAAVVQYNSKTGKVEFYHASFQDFVCDKSRSHSLYIDLESFKARLATAHIQAVSSFDDVELFYSLSSLVRNTTTLRDALTSWEPSRPTPYNSAEDQRAMRASGHRFAFTLYRLCLEYDDLFHQPILRKWLTWFFDLKISTGD